MMPGRRVVPLEPPSPPTGSRSETDSLPKVLHSSLEKSFWKYQVRGVFFFVIVWMYTILDYFHFLEGFYFNILFYFEIIEKTAVLIMIHYGSVTACFRKVHLVFVHLEICLLLRGFLFAWIIVQIGTVLLSNRVTLKVTVIWTLL